MSAVSKLEISTWRDTTTPPVAAWCACLSDYDLGRLVFTGRTQREAINELLDYYELEDGQLTTLAAAERSADHGLVEA